MNTINILIVGVGGQGSLLASRVLGAYFSAKYPEVKLSEVHGMSQRGGSVVTYVRAGEKVFSPLVAEGEADLIISFELLEGLRYIPCLKPEGRLIASTQRISPLPVITGAASYPEDILDRISSAGVRVTAIDALSLALQAGSAKTANMVMLGAASNYIGGEKTEWQAALECCVPTRFIRMNKTAFELGKSA